jgi:hypothetical protein
MNNIVSNKIPNIFRYLLKVKSIDDCIKDFNQSISPENKEKIKEKKFKLNNKNFLNIARHFFNKQSKPTTVLGNLYLPNFHIEFEKTLSENLKKEKIPDLIHKRMFELTEQNIVNLFRLFVLPLFIKCFLPFTYSEDSNLLLYNQIELKRYTNYYREITDYEKISISVGVKHIVKLIIENDKNKLSESDNIIIKKFNDYLKELKRKNLSKLYVYFEYAGIEVNFLEKHISIIINNIIKGSTRAMIDHRFEIKLNKIINFFFILFLVDNIKLFNNLQLFFIEIQKVCNFYNLYILYYKLKYIEEQLSSKNTNAQQFYTSVYDYVVYKLYLDIQEIVEPQILHIIGSFKLEYTFVDALIQQQVAEEQLAKEQLAEEQLAKKQFAKEQFAKEQFAKKQFAKEQFAKEQFAKESNSKLNRQSFVNNRSHPVGNNIKSNNNNITVVSIENTPLNDILNILNEKLEKIKGKPLNNKMRNEIINIDDTYSLIILLQNEYKNEYKDKNKLLKKILYSLKKNYPDLISNYINSVKKISGFFNSFNKLPRKIFNLKKVFNYLIDVFHITNEDIIEAINSEPSYNFQQPPPPYSNISNYPILLEYRPKKN